MGILLLSSCSIAYAETNELPVSINEQTSTTLSIDMAKEIAAFYLVELSGTIPELSGWENAVVEPDITFYDLEGNITAYSFDVMKNSEYDGYIITSATKDKYPILEFSKGQLPTKISTMVEKSENEVENYANKNKLNVGESVPVYEGATFYYTTYDLQDSKNTVKKKAIVDLVTSNLTIQETENFSSSTYNAEMVESEEIEEAWDDLENRITEKRADIETVSSQASVYSIQATGYTKNVSDVPYYLANVLGCSPAAGAMVLGYWDGEGYPNFPSGDTLISECASAMGTSQYSTQISMIDDGIETVCNDHGYTNFNAANDGTLTTSELRSEINSNRPFVLSMVGGQTGSGRSSPYGNHSVTCVGFTNVGVTTVYVWLHDGWSGSSPHYITFGSWNTATATWVRP
jgi:hypothetical protein